MAKFDGNNLKREEEVGLYNVGEPDDDIFQIKDNPYPEEIENFIYKNIEPITIGSGDNDTEITETTIPEPVESTNIFEAEPIINDLEPAQDFKSEDLNQDKLPNEPTTTTVWDDFESNNENIENVEEIQNITEQIKIDDTPVELDNEFKKIIAANLSRKNKEKNDPASDDNMTEPEVIPLANTDDFKPVEETQKTEYYDLTDFGEKRASEKNYDKNEPQSTTEKIDDTKNNKKKGGIWFWVSAASLLILLLLGLAYLFLNNFIPNFYKQEEIAIKDSIKQIITTKTEKNTTVNNQYKDSLDQLSETIDTLQNKLSSGLDSEKISEKPEVNNYQNDNANKETNKEIVEQIKKELQEEYNKSKLAQKETQSKEKISLTEKPIAKKQKTTTSQTENKITKNKINRNKDDIAKHTKKPSTTQEDAEIDNLKTNEKEEEQIYTIQVYASPSKEDAQDWVNKLKNRNFQVSLSTQMIRDVKWYRVRIGSYSTREEAKREAIKYGFAQSWIDRIR